MVLLRKSGVVGRGSSVPAIRAAPHGARRSVAGVLRGVGVRAAGRARGRRALRSWCAGCRLPAKSGGARFVGISGDKQGKGDILSRCEAKPTQNEKERTRAVPTARTPWRNKHRTRPRVTRYPSAGAPRSRARGGDSPYQRTCRRPAKLIRRRRVCQEKAGSWPVWLEARPTCAPLGGRARRTRPRAAGLRGGGGVTGRGDAAMAFVVGGVWRGMRAVSATPVMSCTRETRKRRENAHA